MMCATSALNPRSRPKRVDAFFDTTVLVAASERSHPHFELALPVVKRVAAGHDKGFISAHSIAEIYASLTRLPVQPRIQPVEAMRIVNENVLPHFTAIPLQHDDYLRALDIVGGGGWGGPKIYDALLLQCAARCKVKRIYTFNLGDFRKLAPPGLQPLIHAPGSAV
jgi:predicted nucleic acid-binding protein